MDSANEAPSQEGKGRRILLKTAMFVLKFGIAGAIIYWLLKKDFHLFVESMEKVSPGWLALAALLLFAQLSACAFRWLVILHSQGVRISFFEALSLYLQGFFFSLAIPGGAVGGDVIKAGLIATRAPAGKRVEGALSVLVDRLAGMIALFILVLAMAPFLPLFMAKLAPGMRTAFLFLLAMSGVGLLATALFPFHDRLFKIGLVKTLEKKADALSGGGVGRLLEIIRLYKEKWRAVLGAVLISALLANPLQIACLYCLVIGVSGQAPELMATAIAMLFGGSAAAIPLTPGGIGTRDAVCKAGLMAGGVGAGPATAAPLLFTSIFICISLFGGLLFAFDSFLRRDAGKNPSADESSR